VLFNQFAIKVNFRHERHSSSMIQNFQARQLN